MAEIPQRMAHETDLQRRLSRLSARHRRELRELMGNPPDINRVPAEFWDKVKREREAALLILLLLITTDSQRLHVEQLLPDAFHLDVEDGMSRVAREWSGVRADAVSRSNVVTAQRRLATRAEYWRRFRGDVPAEQIESDLASVLGPQIDSVTASTETTRAQTAGVNGAIGAATAFGIPTRTRWYTRADDRVCPVCAPLHKKIVDLWETVLRNVVVPGGSRAIQEILANGGPPAHAACRCYLITQPEAPARRVRTGILASGAGEMRESNPNHAPAGSPNGGQFTSGGGSHPQTKTKEFRDWFGKSKAVDADGKPKVMYHGTDRSFEEFDIGKDRGDTGVMFFSESPKFASQYADRPGGRVLPVFVKAENPFDATDDSHVAAMSKALKKRFPKGIKDSFGTVTVDQITDWIKSRPDRSSWGAVEKPEIFQAIRDAGFDSVRVKEGGAQNIAIFNGSQIKSATGNRGTFDPKSNKINESHEPGWKKVGGSSVHVNADGRIDKGCPGLKGEHVEDLIDEPQHSRDRREARQAKADAKGLTGHDVNMQQAKRLEGDQKERDAFEEVKKAAKRHGVTPDEIIARIPDVIESRKDSDAIRIEAKRAAHKMTRLAPGDIHKMENRYKDASHAAAFDTVLDELRNEHPEYGIETESDLWDLLKQDHRPRAEVHHVDVIDEAAAMAAEHRARRPSKKAEVIQYVEDPIAASEIW